MGMADTPQGLMQAAKFTEADLAANRAGTLSEAQRLNVQRWSREMRVASFTAWGVFATIIAVLGVIVVIGAPQAALPVGAVLAAVMLIVSFFVGLGLRRASEVASGRVRIAEGVAAKQIKRHDKSHLTRYYVTIGEVRFQLAKGLFDVLDEDAGYRVYYIQNPPPHIVLSIETT
jgi:hypothetical protein